MNLLYRHSVTLLYQLEHSFQAELITKMLFTYQMSTDKRYTARHSWLKSSTKLENCKKSMWICGNWNIRYCFEHQCDHDKYNVNMGAIHLLMYDTEPFLILLLPQGDTPMSLTTMNLYSRGHVCELDEETLAEKRMWVVVQSLRVSALPII